MFNVACEEDNSKNQQLEIWHMANYIITATCKQIELLALACNQAMRIHIGQLADPLTVQLNFEIGYHRHHDGKPTPMEVQEKLEELSKLCWHGKSYGYGYDETSKEYWKLYQIFKGTENSLISNTFQLTFHQLELLRNACELAARLRAGQLDYHFIDELMEAYNKGCDSEEQRNAQTNVRKQIGKACEYLHTLCWDLPPHADHGMNYDDNSDILWDMYQVFRYQIWKENNPNPSGRDVLTVAGDKPYHTGKEPFIRIEKFD